MIDRYTVYVYEDSVEIHGELTIEEAFDFLSFFERKGYKSLILGTENSTLHLLKRDKSEVIKDQCVLDLREEINDLKNSLKKEKETTNKYISKVIELSSLIKEIIPKDQKYQQLEEENQKNLNYHKLLQLKNNPISISITENVNDLSS